ncbi:unnamed protein product [Gongylonema pulchrum]|uniref:CRIB domain-containing protein n=1 Tax=Gongylonema pulchrum TaxID=637853 RepID=A0A183D825_9BILA|nr:unnamed protein product [Gongylonema pulchrum]
MLYQHFEIADEMTVNIFRKRKPMSSPLAIVGGTATANVPQEVPEQVIPPQQPPRPCQEAVLPGKGAMQVVDLERSAEERLAETRSSCIPEMPQNGALPRRSGRLSFSKLPAISEERSGCASGSSLNLPSNTAESEMTPKPLQPVHVDAIEEQNLPTECPTSLQSTLPGTSFTERFINKAMRDFSSTVPVPPPRSGDFNHSFHSGNASLLQVYVEGDAATESDVPFTVFTDENEHLDVVEQRFTYCCCYCARSELGDRF